MEIWLRKALPVLPDPPVELGVLYPQLADGVLVGAARFLRDSSDFRRRQGTAPGPWSSSATPPKPSPPG
jgi:hypothetical protein